MRALIVFADKRIKELPNTPTATELGYPVTASTWTGIAVAKASKTTLSYLDGPGFEKQWDSEYKTFKAVVGK